MSVQQQTIGSECVANALSMFLTTSEMMCELIKHVHARVLNVLTMYMHVDVCSECVNNVHSIHHDNYMHYKWYSIGYLSLTNVSPIARTPLGVTNQFVPGSGTAYNGSGADRPS